MFFCYFFLNTSPLLSNLGKLIRRPLRQALNQILTDKQRTTFKPRTQANIWICLGLSVVAFVGVAVVGVTSGVLPAPFWLPI